MRETGGSGTGPGSAVAGAVTTGAGGTPGTASAGGVPAPHGTGDGLATTNDMRMQFVQAQLSYYAAHLSLADAKAAAIVAFATAISGVTAQKVDPSALLHQPLVGAGALLAILLSGAAILFGFQAVRPRIAPIRPRANGFSWTGVAKAIAQSRDDGTHSDRITSQSPTDMLQGMGDTAESLALVISGKYHAITRAIQLLRVATVLHVLVWLFYRA